jgi:hypothetical protein
MICHEVVRLADQADKLAARRYEREVQFCGHWREAKVEGWEVAGHDLLSHPVLVLGPHRVKCIRRNDAGCVSTMRWQTPQSSNRLSRQS